MRSSTKVTMQEVVVVMANSPTFPIPLVSEEQELEPARVGQVDQEGS